MREKRVAGLESLMLTTELLQRARLADPQAGLWEAADAQWWWSRPRPSDELDRLFWVDDDGPVATVMLTGATDGPWQCDPIIVPGNSDVDLDVVWSRAIAYAASHTSNGFEIPVGDDDHISRGLAATLGLAAGDTDNTAWLVASQRPEVIAPTEGFVLVDRTERAHSRHPMQPRNGPDVAERLKQCSLYDPWLDLAVESADGRVAGYSLYWYDPITKVGLVEPVRVEDEFQRRGLARAMLTAGIDRLVARGAERVKISYRTTASAATYEGIGFEKTSTTTWYRSPG